MAKVYSRGDERGAYIALMPVSNGGSSGPPRARLAMAADVGAMQRVGIGAGMRFVPSMTRRIARLCRRSAV